MIAPIQPIFALAEQVRSVRKRKAHNLYCPFEPAIHPNVDEIQARSVAWAETVGLIQGSTQCDRLNTQKIGRLVSRANPFASTEVVQFAANWTTFFCLLDDHVERLAGANLVCARLAALSNLLRNGGAETADPMERACLELRAQMVTLGSPEWRVRFCARVDELFEAFRWEAVVRSAAIVPTLEAYLPMRAVTVGLFVEFEIAGLDSMSRIGPRAIHHPAVQALSRSVSNIVAWCNDIFTYEKELAEGECTNLVAVLATHKSLSLTRAVARAVAMHDAELASFIVLSRHLPSLGSAEDEALAKHVTMLTHWVRGHLDWGAETGRYDAGRRSAMASTQGRKPPLRPESFEPAVTQNAAHQ